MSVASDSRRRDRRRSIASIGQEPSRESDPHYVPAAGRAALTGLYDLAMAATMRERRWREPLVDRVSELLDPDATVIDVGAGTGTLALAIAAKRPDARVVAVDGDADALARARKKPGSERVEWQEDLAGNITMPSASAGVVVMSLLLHHLQRESKLAALREARRLLRPGGHLVVADWGRPSSPIAGAGFLALRALDGFSNTADHARGRVAELIGAGGFERPSTDLRLPTIWGTLELLRARAPRVR